MLYNQNLQKSRPSIGVGAVFNSNSMLNFSSTASNLTSVLEIVMAFGTNAHGAQLMNPGDFEGFWWNISVLPCWHKMF